jgi:hypothetical protein
MIPMPGLSHVPPNWLGPRTLRAPTVLPNLGSRSRKTLEMGTLRMRFKRAFLICFNSLMESGETSDRTLGTI